MYRAIISTNIFVYKRSETVDKIEIFDSEILNLYQSLVEDFNALSRELHIGLGWHYLLDLSWAAQQLNPRQGMQVMDAGAGRGVMQWWLAEQGVNVISVDRVTRRNYPMNFRQRYQIQGMHGENWALKTNLYNILPPLSPLCWHLYPQKLIAFIRYLRHKPEFDPICGTVYIYNHDLKSMTDIPDESMDAIVSISALEHNPPDELKACVAELMRVLKPGGKLIATMAAAKEKDWFHEPSRGWCYTDTTLREIFDLPSDCLSNYDRCDELFESLRNCSELRNNLADFYFQSENNGMPWGIWDPKYQPVGVVKIKPFE